MSATGGAARYGPKAPALARHEHHVARRLGFLFSTAFGAGRDAPPGICYAGAMAMPKTAPLVRHMIVALALGVAGCGNSSSTTSPAPSAAPASEAAPKKTAAPLDPSRASVPDVGPIPADPPTPDAPPPSATQGAAPKAASPTAPAETAPGARRPPSPGPMAPRPPAEER
ncbi:hypothetical protein [Polyangium aurulentum]|uniref:hypothetical protein n=1 Tax=Polyangium aurulentum TaxID=2567896 RepID=UPI0010AE7DC7|nr:hypothetical protein [Polyangium aurulentum]UQA62599.1 hypothetical protein E8A73_019950 [Polyangium aurulentum]